MSEPATRRLFLIRHGLPDYTLGKAGDVPPGPTLSYIGRTQIRQAIDILHPHKPMKIYSSPLARALQSAAVVAEGLGQSVEVDGDLQEWRRTERLYQVNERCARWLARWLRREEPIAVAFSHASPLLSLMRTALYLPHFNWWHGTDRDHLVLATCDRFEVSMGSVFELVFEPDVVTARCLHHPHPRITHIGARGNWVTAFSRPGMTGENRVIRRPNFGFLVGDNVKFKMHGAK